MFQTSSPSWLIDCHDALVDGGSLQATALQCWKLTHGFVGCNLVANLAQLITGIGNRWPGSVFGGHGAASYADFGKFFFTPPNDWHTLDPFTDQTAMLAGPFCNDPWWQIDRWLGIEACFRVLAPRIPSPRPPGPCAWDHARATFEGVAVSNGLNPVPCHRRDNGGLEAFRVWWETTADSLHDYIKAATDQEPGKVSLKAVVQFLAFGLCNSIGENLLQLTRVKNQLLWLCILQLNQERSGPVPTPDGWLAQTGSIFLDASVAGEDLQLGGADLANFSTLFTWLSEAGLAPLPQRLQAALGAQPIPNSYLPVLLEELTILSRRISTRGLPDDWDRRKIAPVPDLFAFSIAAVGFSFNSWWGMMNDYYHFPSDKI